ncbi:hypothetical protein BJX76DRAFT_354731 [Aspergillus varians]
MATLMPNPLIAPVLPTELSYPISPDLSFRCNPTPSPNPQISRLGPHAYKLLTRIGDICRGENVYYSTIDFCGRRSAYELNADPVTTLLVVAERREDQGSWVNLARKLAGHLRGRALQEVSVEIIDPKFAQRPMIHPCLPTDDIFPVWKQVASDIFHGINRTGVFTIGCFRIGSIYDRLQCPPTILLGEDRGVKRDWRQLRETVVGILDRHSLSAVAVMIRKDNKISRDGGLDSAEPGAMVQHCRLDPKPTPSLSPRSLLHGHGTLGGARLLPINSPSYHNITKGIKRLTSRIEKLKSGEKYRQVKDLKARDECIMPHLQRGWAHTLKNIAVLQREHLEMTRFFAASSHRFGMVFAASGLRAVQSTDDPTVLSIRDCAPGCGQKHGHGKDFTGLVIDHTFLNSFFFQIPASQSPEPLKQLSGFLTKIPYLDDELYKVGRATSYTLGYYSKLKSCHIATRIINSKEVDVKSYEHVVVRSGHTVAQEGDSSSLVFNNNGFVLGMIFGGNGSYDLGYFTSTRDLLADIKNITGANDVRLRYSST